MKRLRKHLTQPLATHLKRYKTAESLHILKLGIPIAFAQLANFLLNVEDVAFVGRLGVAQLGGISVANALFHVFMIGALGFLLSLDFFISHAYGARDQKTASNFLAHGLYLATGVGIPLTFIIYASPFILELLGQDPSVVHHATIYLKTITWSLWPFLVFAVFRQYLQAMNLVKAMIIILIAANVVNIVANYLLVFGWEGQVLGFAIHIPRLEIVGSGWATVIARTFMALTSALYTFYYCHKKGITLFAREIWHFSSKRAFEILRVGAPASGQVLLEIGAFATATILAGRLGPVPLAAHQSALQIASITFMIPLGLASAGAVRVAQSLGAGHQHQAVKVGWTAILLGTSVMGGFGIIMTLIPELLVSLFTPDMQVIATGARLMMIAAFFQLFDGAQVVGSGVLRGIGNTRASFIANLVGHWGIGLPLGTLLAFTFGLGVFGIWLGLSLGLVLVSGGLIWAWKKQSTQIEKNFSRVRTDSAPKV